MNEYYRFRDNTLYGYWKGDVKSAYLSPVVGKVEFRVCGACGKQHRSDKKAYGLYGTLTTTHGEQIAVCPKCVKRLLK